LIGVPHFGHRDPGEMMESSSGIRVMQTFRKLPITIPNRKKKMDMMTTVELAASRPLLVLSHSLPRLSTNPFALVPHS
jgi:hypothetical protein